MRRYSHLFSLCHLQSRWLLVAGSAVLGFGCGCGAALPSQSQTPAVSPQVTAILVGCSPASVRTQESTTCSAAITCSIPNACLNNLIWSVSTGTIIGDGTTVTAVAPGSPGTMVVSASADGVSGSANVAVTAAPPRAVPPTITWLQTVSLGTGGNLVGVATDGVSVVVVGHRMNSTNDGNVGVAFAFQDVGQSATFLGGVDMGTTNSGFESAAVASSDIISGSVGGSAAVIALNSHTGQTISVVQCPIGDFTAMARDAVRTYYVSGSSLFVGDLAGGIDCNQKPIAISGTKSGVVRRIAIGPSNHIIAVGDFIDFSTPPQFRSGFVTDVDIATGNPIWSRADSELASVQGLSVSVAIEDGAAVVYISGTQWPSLTTNNMFVTKWAEADGQTISPWPVKVDTRSSLPGNFAADVVPNRPTSGGIVLAGHAPKSGASSSVSTEAFFAGLAPDGKVLWTFRDNLAVGNSDGIQAAAATDSAIYVTGTFGQSTPPASIGLVAKFALP